MQVKEPNESDWNKLIRLMKSLNGTKDNKLRMSMDNIKCIKWYIDAAFTVHADYKSHTGATMTFREGAVQSISQKNRS